LIISDALALGFIQMAYSVGFQMQCQHGYAEV